MESNRRSAKRFSRRNLFRHFGGVVALPFLTSAVRAQSYPTRAVRVVVGYAPGGATDLTARVMAERLSSRLRQQLIVENRPGAATNIATEQVIRASPDGYTLLVASAANAINATIYGNLNFEFIRDTAAVAGVCRMQNVLTVHPSILAHTPLELVEYAKQHPNRLIAGSAGNGSPGHVSADLFKMMTGIEMLHIPYRGVAPALADLIGGRINVMFDNMATAIEHIRSGKIRALAVTTTFRSPLLPDLPTVSETVPGYESSSWYGFVAPKGTAPEIVKVLNSEINAILAEPAVSNRFAEMGAATLAGIPADFGNLIVAETEKWGRVVRFAKIKPT